MEEAGFVTYTAASHQGADVLASLFRSCHVIHLYIQSVYYTRTVHILYLSMSIYV